MPKSFGSKRFSFFEDARRRAGRDTYLLEFLKRIQSFAAEAKLRYPKADLQEAARRLGVLEVRRAPLGVHGRLVSEHGSPVVELDEKLSPFRARFTLAHELAHLALGDRPSALAYERFEVACDACADELLLPDQQLRDTLLEAPDPYEALWTLSDPGLLPVDYLYRRALRAGAIAPRPAFWCRGNGTDFYPVASIPPRDELQLSDIRITDGRDAPLANASQTKRPARGTLFLREPGIHQAWFSAIGYPLTDGYAAVLVVLQGRAKAPPN